MKTLLALAMIFALTTPLYSQGTDIDYTEGSNKLKGYFVKAQHAQGKAPGVIILHAWMGLQSHEKRSAEKLAELGYDAFAADVYGEANQPKSVDDAKKATGYYKNNIKIYHARIKAAIDQLIKLGADPDNIAVIGYCFGGTGALEAARSGMPIKGVVSFHGGLSKAPESPNNPINAKVLVLHGADDPSMSDQQIKDFQNEMREDKADWQMIYYANAMHSFTEPEVDKLNAPGNAYNEKAAKRSWEHMKQFLGELFVPK